MSCNFDLFFLLVHLITIDAGLSSIGLLEICSLFLHFLGYLALVHGNLIAEFVFLHIFLLA